ncbi:MAG: transporter [Burkholderiaceae bacterium]|nr:transporter [Burkholderiales bacterium]MCZ8341284.1 transporter [Burkholderiaceae bacterium]
MTTPNRHTARTVRTLAAASVAAIAPLAAAQPQPAGDAELLKKLANPIAALISLPFQYTHDREIGPARSGSRDTLNIQPVVPFELNADWNLISRTIVPVLGQRDVFPGAGSQTGVGDVLQSVFLSPKKPTEGGWIWGAGPVFLLPTATNDLLGANRWAVGPTGVALRQQGPLTYGLLANHLVSVGGGQGADINSTYLQPFASWATPTLWTFQANLEATRDWERRTWSIPLNVSASRLLDVGGQKVSLGAGVGYWLESPEGGPHGWRVRLVATLLFPR